MIRKLGAAVLAAFLASPATVAAQGAAAPETRREQIGDWTVICTVNGNNCVMSQIGKAQGEDALAIEILKLPEPQTRENQRIEAVARFLVPLNVLLQPGLRLRIDSGETTASPYFLCQANGCTVQAPLQKALLDAFRRGSRATFTYTLVQNNQTRDVSVPISLSGFTRAYNALK